ncbi:uncharacterized protein LOC106053164 isoform X3 [Biomphalaria glabrata]|uniref:Uncharacterized protein LOC106053164 isoform X3 n=1 Tax=Biomphalaria glabrata TaxID=6526 RepID=A0A9W2YZR5_BIOGL|nr:uncharacterized protein LOC106053164 isoform X3 [Biomphalaria glabrata]
MYCWCRLASRKVSMNLQLNIRNGRFSYKNSSEMRVDRSFPLNTDSEEVCWSHDPCRITLGIFTDAYDNFSVGHQYQSVIDLVDPSLKLFCETEREVPFNSNSPQNDSSFTPSLALMLFLRGSDADDNVSSEDQFRLRKAMHIFQHPPWRFHHSEKVNQEHMNALPQNSQDFYLLAPDLPLWALRQVHYGREHIRYVLYTQDDSWADQVQFYSLLIGLKPELLRADFCLFTLYANEHYDVQFALKKQPGNVQTLAGVQIQIKVKDIGQLVPLFPNVCRPISDVHWETMDHDGNIVVLNLIKTKQDHTRAKTMPKRSYCPPAGQYTNNNICSSEDSDFFSLTSSSEDFSMKSGYHTYSNMVSPTEHLNMKAGYHTYSNMVSPTEHLNMKAGYHTYSNMVSPCISEPSSHFIFDSTSSDLDCDLPLVSRCKHKEEDETSLTPTTTSEESGIQNCSDDASYCEEDSLKSCLSVSSKHRIVKLKVRFKDEVQTFDEDTCSQHSSGIDSDSEMETKFSFTPLNKTLEQNDQPSQDINFLHQRNHQTNNDARILSQSSSYQNVSKLPQNKFHYTDKHVKGSCFNSGTPPLPTTFRLCDSRTSSNNQNVSTLKDNLSYSSSLSNNNVEQCYNKSKNAADSKDSTSFRTSDQLSSGPLTHPKVQSIQEDKTTMRGHHMSRSPQRCAGSAQPPPPPVRDINTRLRSVSCSDTTPSNLVAVTKQNGQQKFYFEVTPTTVGSSPCPDKNGSHQDTALKFTLKYDTGLSSGQEQVGFYV